MILPHLHVNNHIKIQLENFLYFSFNFLHIINFNPDLPFSFPIYIFYYQTISKVSQNFFQID